jgi:hypothetical protein
MEIYIQNNNNSIHTICRTTGEKLNINPKSYIVLDTDNEQEIHYWTNLNKNVADRIGLTIALNRQSLMNSATNSISNCNNYNNKEYTNVSVFDNNASPIARQIAESILHSNKNNSNNTNISDTQSNSLSPDNTNNNSNTIENGGFYSEEQLLEMDKEDLMNLCNNFDIKYRKNSTVKTLVNLLLNNIK